MQAQYADGGHKCGMEHGKEEKAKK